MSRRLTVWNPWSVSPFDMPDWVDWSGEMDVKLNMYEDGDNVVVELVAPGFSKEDVDLKVEGNMMTISGNAQEVTEDEDRKRKYYRKEISQRSFSRTAELPSAVDASNSKAIFKDGILTVTLPKREEAKPRSIKIEAE